MNIANRLETLIKELRITKARFGKDIGLSASAVSQICGGKTTPSTSTIKAICLTYNVNKEWLTEGKGEIFAELPEETELGYILGAALKDERAPYRIALMKAIAKASPETVSAIVELARQLMKDCGIEEDK